MPVRKNLIVIIDRSGSMSLLQRMNLARTAALTVLDGLRPEDYVSIAEFNICVTILTSLLLLYVSYS